MFCLTGHKWRTLPTIHTEEKVLNINRYCQRCGKKEDFDIPIDDKRLRAWWLSLCFWIYRGQE